jgi:N-methylhydantoinase A/oxoprolinase/acetone carboxylase beta subunit
MFKTWAQKIAAGLADHAELSSSTVLSAFGGGGPMGVMAVAEAAGLDTVLVPRLSAVFSAHGIGFSDIAHFSELKLASNDTEGLAVAMTELNARVARDMFSEGFELKECQLQAWLRINGEKAPMDVGMPRLSGAVAIGAEDEVIAGLRAIKAVNRAQLPEKSDVETQGARVDASRVLVNADGSTHDLPVIKVEHQVPGVRGVGPAVIEEDFWTCKVESDWSFEFTGNGDVLFRKSAR